MRRDTTRRDTTHRAEGENGFGALGPNDGVVMVWGGLRGAVGLALAISVKSTISDTVNGDRVVFHISGLAFLTLIVNGTTSGLVLQACRDDVERKDLVS